jgi:hypothetical protein
MFSAPLSPAVVKYVDACCLLVCAVAAAAGRVVAVPVSVRTRNPACAITFRVVAGFSSPVRRLPPVTIIFLSVISAISIFLPEETFSPWNNYVDVGVYMPY